MRTAGSETYASRTERVTVAETRRTEGGDGTEETCGRADGGVRDPRRTERDGLSLRVAGFSGGRVGTDDGGVG